MERKSSLAKRKMLQALTRGSTNDLNAAAPRLQAEGQTVMFVGINDQIAGILAVSDPIKQTTPLVVDHRRWEGIKVVMLTGDNERPPAR